MGRRLLEQGFSLQVFDLNKVAVASLEEKGAKAFATAKEACVGAKYVIVSLPNDKIVEMAVFGTDGIAEGLGADAVYIEMSTISPMTTVAIGEKLLQKGLRMVDAPVGRSPAHALEGKLLVMAGGTTEDIERAMPVLNALGDPVVKCGPLGAGHKLKLVNNYMSGVINLATAETLCLADKLGLDQQACLGVLRATPAGMGPINTTYPAKVLAGDVSPGFTNSLIYKDLGLAIDLAGQVGAPVTLGSVARALYGTAISQGMANDDWTSAYNSVRIMAALPKYVPTDK